VYRKDILEEAWRAVEENRGAPGPDGISIWDIKEGDVDKFLNELQQELRDGTYHSGPVRRVEIEKPNGGTRSLGIPNVRDRVVQAAVKSVIEPIFEADFKPLSFGFRPGRSAIDACKEVYKWLNFGLDYVIDVDIAHCFDDIPHSPLMKLLSERVSDKYILKLIKMWLRAPILIDGTLCSAKKGTPQGGVISPLLANIYLHQLDTEWLKRGMTNRYGPNAQLVRYADDIVILSNKPPRYPFFVLCEILSELGLSLNEKKTAILRAGTGFDFLGFRFIRRFSKKHGKLKTYRFPSRSSVKRIKSKIRACADNHVLHVPPEEVAKRLNQLVLGWQNYFCHSNAAHAFNKVLGYVIFRFRRYLRRRKNKRGIGKGRAFSNEALMKCYGLLTRQGIAITYG
jgi:group II intron reverse transcriptase/maturase